MKETNWLFYKDTVQKAVPLNQEEISLMSSQDLYELVKNTINKYVKLKNKTLKEIGENKLSKTLIQSNFTLDMQIWIGGLNRILRSLMKSDSKPKANNQSISPEKEKRYVMYHWIIQLTKEWGMYFDHEMNIHPLVRQLSLIESRKKIDQTNQVIIDLLNNKGE